MNKKFINFRISDQMIFRTNNGIVRTKTENYIYANFSFSPEWDNLSKRAIFEKTEEEQSLIYDINIIDNQCKVPDVLFLNKGEIKVSVESLNSTKITTNFSSIIVKESGFMGDLPEPEMPDSSEQYVKTYTEQGVFFIRNNTQDYETDTPEFWNGSEWKKLGTKGNTGEKGDTGEKGEKGDTGDVFLPYFFIDLQDGELKMSEGFKQFNVEITSQGELVMEAIQ